MSKKFTFFDVQTLASSRNHTLVSMNGYQNVKSLITIQCNTCSCKWTTSLSSYLNAKKTGCPGCKKSTISQIQTNKHISEATRKRISEKANKRPGSLKGVIGEKHPRYKGGIARDLKKPSYADYVWKTGIRKLFNYRCVLTGVRKKLVAHHLNGFNKFPTQRYDLRNGVLIERNIHKVFHDRYGYGNNTEEQWVEFCKTEYEIDWYEMKKTYHANLFE